MKKFLKWIGIVLLVIIIGILGTGFYLVKKADKILAKKFNIDPPVFAIPGDSLSIAKGAKFAMLCTDCHGKKLEGFAFFNDPKLGILHAPNLTRGKGSAVSYYTDKDWIQSVRHGVRPNGDGLLVMPAKDYYYMSKEDIASLIAYVKQIEPVDNVTGKNSLTTMGKILMAMNAFGEMHSASLLDHSKPVGDAPAAAANAEYGKYLLNISGCKSCHGEMLNGGKHPDPNSPPVPNLTSKGNLKHWNKDQFIATIKTGTTPEGKKLHPKYMPYASYSALSDDDLTAIYLYLQSLPPTDTPK